MSTRNYIATTSVIFFLVAVVHLLRLVEHWSLTIDGWHVPSWTSVVSVIVAGFLSLQGFWLFRQGRWFPWLR